MAVTLADYNWGIGQENFGGLGSTVYLCPWANVLTFPKLVTSKTSPADFIKLDAAINVACKTGNKFIKVYITSETGMIKSESVGPRDAKAFKNTFDGSTPGSEADLLGLLSYLSNTPLLAFVVELSGQIRMLGDELVPAYLEKVDAQSGGKVEDGKFTKWEITSHGRQAYIYTGTIPLTNAA